MLVPFYSTSKICYELATCFNQPFSFKFSLKTRLIKPSISLIGVSLIGFSLILNWNNLCKKRQHYSLFFNAEAEANRKFQQITERISSLRQEVDQVSEKPSIVWGYYAGRDKWLVHSNSVEAQFLRDAGLNNILEDFYFFKIIIT